LGLESLLEFLDVALELALDLASQRALLLLEDLDVPLDLASQRALLDFEQAPLFLEFLFEQLEGWERHVG
jgi:hypothetical protein